MNDSKIIYEIILDLWRFMHKHCDELEQQHNLNWDLIAKEYTELTEDKSTDNELVNDFRNKIFANGYNYLRYKEMNNNDKVE